MDTLSSKKGFYFIVQSFEVVCDVLRTDCNKTALYTAEEPSLDSEKDNNYSENPVSIEEKKNNATFWDTYGTESEAQKSQNLTDSHTTLTTSNNNASFNGIYHYPNASQQKLV
jgi:hypothetical protein